MREYCVPEILDYLCDSTPLRSLYKTLKEYREWVQRSIHLAVTDPLLIKTAPYASENQLLICIRSTDTKAEASIPLPPDAKRWVTGKDPEAGKKLRAGEEAGERGGDGWMASLAQWTWV